MRGIAAVKPGARMSAISATPSRPSSKAQRFSVVRDFCGHGLGRVFHDAPNILHYGQPGQRAGAAGPACSSPSSRW